MTAVKHSETPTLEALRARRDEILRLAAQHGAQNVRVFGSVARGRGRAGGDVDFLVDLEPGHDPLDLGELSARLEEALGHRVDVVQDIRKRRTLGAMHIRRSAVPL